MKKIKVIVASALLVGATCAHVYSAAGSALVPQPDSAGKGVVIFVHDPSVETGDGEVDSLAVLHQLRIQERQNPNLVVHEVAQGKHDTSLASVQGLCEEYAKNGAKNIKIVHHEDHDDTDFNHQYRQVTPSARSRAIDMGKIQSAGTQALADNPNAKSDMVQGLNSIATIVKNQHATMEALPKDQRPGWGKRFGACFCAAAGDDQVQTAVVDAAKIAIQIAMAVA
ncbi:hypothetical protein K2W90_06305 [Candidatus Babeliales bacterium]|nr:hypothetical protein [Candidatus Babeliales bacterium]